MDFLATTGRRKFLFAALYLSEGAPIGFIWLAFPTQLRALGVPVKQLGALAAVLVIPWTFKFAWAPLVDGLRGRHWTLRNWILAAQGMMGATLAPLLWLDPLRDFELITVFLLAHAFAAATQDVAIDALCINVTEPYERASYNGWMQAGMLTGRAMLGGGALVLMSYVGAAPVVLLLIAVTTFSMILVTMSKLPAGAGHAEGGMKTRFKELAAEALRALRLRNTWLGLLFAFTGGAAFKSLEVVYGAFLIDRGYTKGEIGWFSAGPMIGAMILGALVAGIFADRVGQRRFVGLSLVFIVLAIAALAFSDLHLEPGPHLFVCLAATAFGIGLFTASLYALFMDLTLPAIAATQFSAFMGATNGCESWSSYSIGHLAESYGYAAAFLSMCAVSLLAIPILFLIRPRVDES